MTDKIKAIKEKEVHDIQDLIKIMKILRTSCPWDREQTHESIRNNLIEETYEVVEAIDTNNKTLMREELGALLLQVVFHAQMEEEAGVFDFNDVSNDICKKLIHRHPHIFGDVTAETSEKVLSNWDKIKQEEKHQETLSDELKSVSKALPSLIRGFKLTKKAGKRGINIVDDTELEKFEGESDVEGAVGRELLKLCAICVKLGIDPEEALYKTCDNFIESVESMGK